jgi:hypothetical protein
MGNRTIERDGVRVYEQRTMDGARLRANLHYETDAGDDMFEWQLYTPEELTQLGSALGLDLLLACAEFDERIPASAEHARMQLVFTN